MMGSVLSSSDVSPQCTHLYESTIDDYRLHFAQWFTESLLRAV